MSDVAIRVEALSKLYRIGDPQPRYHTLRDRLADAFASPFRRMWSAVNGTPSPNGGRSDTIWALKDVSFEVKRGEVIGVIGRNGAGKTTLLKVLSRITEPTEGRAVIHGRVGSLLEVGTGFHPELTGRENIYLNGAILGMRKVEIDRKFNEIVAFAETGKFIDTPVKWYSTGMYVRLAFAVAAHLDSEILLVDEVLAVGDAAFQKKCFGKVGEVAQAGRTVLLVSHNMAAIQRLCARTLLLGMGRLVFDAQSGAVVQAYLGEVHSNAGTLDTRGRRFPPRDVQVRDAWLELNGVRTGAFVFGDAPNLMLEVEVLLPTRFSVELILRQSDGAPVAFAPSGLAQGWEVNGKNGIILVQASLPTLRVAQGPYSLDVILADAGVRFLDYIESGVSFYVDSTAIGTKNWAFSQSRGQGCQLWDVAFRLV